MVTQKELLMSVFINPGIRYCYTLKDDTGAEQEYSVPNINNFKSLKRFFRKRMDDNLNVTYKGKKSKLISAYMIDEEETFVGDMEGFLNDLKNGQVVDLSISQEE